MCHRRWNQYSRASCLLTLGRWWILTWKGRHCGSFVLLADESWPLTDSVHPVLHAQNCTTAKGPLLFNFSFAPPSSTTLHRQAPSSCASIDLDMINNLNYTYTISVSIASEYLASPSRSNTTLHYVLRSIFTLHHKSRCMGQSCFTCLP